MQPDLLGRRFGPSAKPLTNSLGLFGVLRRKCVMGKVQNFKEEVTTESIRENLGGNVISRLRLSGHIRQSLHALITHLEVVHTECGLNLHGHLSIVQHLNDHQTSVKVCLSQRH